MNKQMKPLRKDKTLKSLQGFLLTFISWYNH